MPPREGKADAPGFTLQPMTKPEDSGVIGRKVERARGVGLGYDEVMKERGLRQETRLDEEGNIIFTQEDPTSK